MLGHVNAPGHESQPRPYLMLMQADIPSRVHVGVVWQVDLPQDANMVRIAGMAAGAGGSSGNVEGHPEPARAAWLKQVGADNLRDCLVAFTWQTCIVPICRMPAS